MPRRATAARAGLIRIGGRSLRLLRTLALATVLVVGTMPIQAGVAAAPGKQDVGEESKELFESLQQFMEPRAAPADQPPAAAWPAAVAAARSAPVASAATRWTEIGPRNYQTDDPNFADPIFSNSGAGAGLASGRMTALAVTRDGRTVFAGAAGGGVWKSTDAGATWTPVTDFQDTLSIGAIAVDEAARGYTVYVGTGEANTNADSYAGVGILKSTDGGKTWARMGSNELVGATVYRIVVDPVDHARLYAATSHGLFRWTAGSTAWQRILGSGTSIVANMVTDVVVRPGTGGATGDVVAVVGWRDGAATNGLFESRNGGDTFLGPYNAQGYVPGQAQGRVSLSYAADGSRLYAVVQDPSAFSVPASKTVLQGVYVSRSGSPQGPFTQIADSSKLSNSGSAMKVNQIGFGFQPGVQTWYDQFVLVDPADANHLYLGLEEVFETTDSGVSWTTIGPYWNFPFKCFSYTPLGGTCPNTTHPDQHAAAIANGTLWVANDGGVFSRLVANHQVGGWSSLNKTLGTLQFYYVGAGQAPGGPLTIYGGLQDNGTAKVIPSTGLATEPAGGDGGAVIVDPTNPDNVVGEFTDLFMYKSRNGGHSWSAMGPADPNPRFIAPFVMDATIPTHFVAAGEFVWDSTKGFDTECNTNGCDWTAVYDQGAGHTTTALGATGGVIYAAWCGPCNPNMSTGVGFKSGLATNFGGTWHQLAPPLASRFLQGLRVDPANPAHAYAVYSGYSRRWILGPLDAGVGHVFETNDGGAHWTDISGDLVDAPASALAMVGNYLVVATDVGVFVSGPHGGSWQRLGSGLPNTIAVDLVVSPRGDQIILGTHGRGIWSFPTAALP